MTLSELVAILGVDESVSVPTSLEDLEIVNTQDYCRWAQKNYFESSTFYDDTIHILNELVIVFDINLVSLKDFALIFKRCDDRTLHLELTHNCY